MLTAAFVFLYLLHETQLLSCLLGADCHQSRLLADHLARPSEHLLGLWWAQWEELEACRALRVTQSLALQKSQSHLLLHGFAQPAGSAQWS